MDAEAADCDSTDWRQIRVLYDKLDTTAPSPVVRLNRAIATMHVHGAQKALDEVDALRESLDGYRLFHAVRGELLEALGRTDEARQANEQALELATNLAERELLARRLSPSVS